jgi:hypothetical protein
MINQVLPSEIILARGDLDHILFNWKICRHSGIEFDPHTLDFFTPMNLQI